MNKQSQKPPIIELLIVIVNKDKGERAIKLLNDLDISLQILCFGKGTADSKVADYFGLDMGEKQVIFSLIKLKHSKEILRLLNDKLQLDSKNSGIAMTIPIKSAMYSLVEKMGFSYQV